jgi:hypothetical protein
MDGANFFADVGLKGYAMQVAAMTASEVRRQAGKNKVLCPKRPAVCFFHARSRVFMADASLVECRPTTKVTLASAFPARTGSIASTSLKLLLDHRPRDSLSYHRTMGGAISSGGKRRTLSG